MTIQFPTSKLPAYVRHLIRDMREGVSQWCGTVVIDSIAGLHARKPKRYAPREVCVRFCPGTHARINVAAFDIHAVNGDEVNRDTESTTYLGSDGEPNYEQYVTFRGPVVAHYGYGKRAYVEVLIPTGRSDEGRAPGYFESPHQTACELWEPILEKGDAGAFAVLVDAALEEKAFPLHPSRRAS